VLASDRGLADDAVGQQALRGWLGQGATCGCRSTWCARDGAALWGDVLAMQVVERVSLTSVQLVAGSANVMRPEAEARRIEQPVPFVQVLAPDQLRSIDTVDGWPAGVC